MTHPDPIERYLSEGLEHLARETAPPDARPILARTAVTRQHGPGRRPWLRPSDDGAIDRFNQTLTGRSFLMSILRYGSIAVIALAAGLTLPALLSSPSPAPVPEATWVTGTIELTNSCDDPTSTIVKGVGRQYRGYACGPQLWTASDPRLTGNGTTTWNSDDYGSGGVLSVATMLIETPEGTWTCTAPAVPSQRYTIPGGQPLPTLSECTGSDGLAGLIASIRIDDNAQPVTFEGAILRGDLPTAP